MEATLLDHWKSIPIEKYDGSTDPEEHLNVFLTQATLSTQDDSALCRIFPTSLKGRALCWFTRLPSSSIASFNELSSQFTLQFATSKPYRTTSLALAGVRQEKKESLRSFMDRFNNIAMEIGDLNRPWPWTDFRGVDPVQDDPMVISVEMHNCIVKKTLVDQGSSADILYWNTFKQLGIPEESLEPYHEPLVGFSGERVMTRGSIDLYTRFGFDQKSSREIKIRYIVVHANTSYNILLGRPSINALGAIVSTPHLCMKFPSRDGQVITVHADQKTARECYLSSLKMKPLADSPKAKGVNAVGQHVAEDIDLDPRLDEERIEPAENLVSFQLGRSPEQVTNMGSQLSETDANRVKGVVRDNRDLFAWTTSDMPGIDPKFLCHRLAVCRDARPVAQKKRKMGDEKRKAANAEVKKLLQAGFIREVTYTTWLANVVLVRKLNGKWRMCTDYTDLNKACPKDAYPLPCIDRLVDGASGHSIFSFLDAYSGYNQIRMHPSDEEKTTFITENANFCYRVMPFGLKNVGATYQRLMDRVFREQISRNIEIYMDDIVVKSNSPAEHITDLAEIFGELRKHNMRLNPEKCTFGVRGGKFLGFMLSARGIEANRDKCQAVLDMRSQSNLKELQRLSGRLVALSRFLPRLGDKISPMTKLLRKASAFAWNELCEEAFLALKASLATPPILTRPDPLLVYLAVCVDNMIP
uniref:Transposon Ty3-I Gag-Pol polyprotein n=1 Tax=Cajanus cajan TaxID=3821 RepID=A0A151TJB2_CAJCA|nr:Transposon Ty3-I Gag-Pol polyprotein [Cajanus cajan]